MGQQPRQVPRIVFGADDIDPAPVVFGAEEITPLAPVPAHQPPTPGFFEEATQSINPLKINEAIQTAFWQPLNTAGGMVSAHDALRVKAQEALKQGDVQTALRHFGEWMIPIATGVAGGVAGIPGGPPGIVAGLTAGTAGGIGLASRLSQGSDYLEQGETARGLGALTDVGVSMATPSIVGRVARAVPTRAGTATAAARAGEQQIVKTITPTVGPEKLRIGTMAADVAGDVARRTTSRTVGGLYDEIVRNATTAQQRLDNTYDALSQGQPTPTQPIIAALQRQIANLGVRGARGAHIMPATRAERLASLNQALAEVRALGQSVRPDQLRRLRIAWDEGAETVWTPITADNFRAARQTGHGWADARTALNEVLVTRHPELRDLNADAHVWMRAGDVMRAAEEVERVRPTVGRTIMSRGLGASAGALLGGGMGATAGVLLAPTIEAAIQAATPSARLIIGRRLVALSDALQVGQPGPIRAAIANVSAALPSAQQAAFTAQALRLMHGALAPVPAHQPARAAATETERR